MIDGAVILDEMENGPPPERTGYTKWDSIIDLKRVGLPTLPACFIPPGISRDDIEGIVDKFKKTISTPKIMIRSDAKKEAKDYVRLGVSLPPEQAAAKAYEVSQTGRAIILFPETSRFASYWSHNTLVDTDGSFAIELMGPGFDGSGLSRGDMKPLYSIRSKPLAPSLLDFYKEDFDNQRDKEDGYPLLKLEIIKDDTPPEERVRLRLEQIARHILPNMGVKTNNSSEFAERWLKKNGYDFLWTKKDAAPDTGLINMLCRDSAKLGRYLIGEGRFSATTLSGFMLDIGGKKAKNIYLEYFNDKKWDNQLALLPKRKGR